MFAPILTLTIHFIHFQVLKHECRPAAKFGEHFASLIRRTSVTYRKAGSTGDFQKTLIVKTMMPGETNDSFNEMLRNSPVFATEVRMYTKTLPTMSELLRRAGYDDEIIAPK